MGRKQKRYSILLHQLLIGKNFSIFSEATIVKIRILCSSCSQMHQRSFFSLFKTVINCYLNTIFPQTPSCCYLLVVSSLIRNHVISRMTSRCEALASHRIGLKKITASIFFPVCSLLHLLKGRYFSQRKEYQGCI